MPRVAPEARARREEARRTQILEAAAAVFARKGFDRATIADVARAAGLAEGSIYNYFRSKEALLFHIPQHLMRPVLRPLAAAPPPRDAAELERTLRTLAQGMVARVRAHAGFVKVFLSALPSLTPRARRAYLQLLPPVYAAGVLEAFLREGAARGLLRADLDAAVAARLLPGMLFVFLMLQEVVLERRVIPRSYEAIVAEAVRIFLYGAAAPGARSGASAARRGARGRPARRALPAPRASSVSGSRPTRGGRP